MKTELERATKLSLKAIKRIAVELGGTIVRPTVIKPYGELARCWDNTANIMEDGQRWYGYRIHPIDSNSCDPNRSLQREIGHLCFEEHYVVKTADNQWHDNTPSDTSIDGYQHYYIAVRPATTPLKDFVGNWEYTKRSGLSPVPLSANQRKYYA
jgi:hypothetical protein